MKRLALTLVAGAFGTLMALPIAYAQDMQNMNNDAGSVPGDSAAGAATTSEQVDVQKRTENVQGDLGASTQKQVEVQKRTENVQNNALGTDALGTDTTQKQVDIQKRSDVQGGAFGPTTHEQVDVQKRSESVNNSMNDSTPNTAPADN